MLKYPNQTTAIDIWSAGVIFLCFLSGKYPFFKASNDHFAMIEIVTLFGSERCANVAKLLHKDITCSPTCHPQNLISICEHLRSSLHTQKQKGYGSNTKSHSLKDDFMRLHSIKPNCDVKFEPTIEHSSSSESNMSYRDASPTFSSAVTYDLLERCLDVNPFTRITGSQALQHPFFRQK